MKRIHVIAIVFVLGLLFCCTYKHTDLIEGFNASDNCPNLLVQKGNELHLIYKNKARIPGVNPIKFKSLEEYVEFLNWQRAKGIRCPVLYFQQSYDAQNNKGYRMLPDLIEKQGGLPSNIIRPAKEQPLYDANHDDMPYNKNSYPGFDTQDQYVGVYTALDKNFNSNSKVSANPMDTNWGGAEYTDDMVLKGVYTEDSRPSVADISKKNLYTNGPKPNITKEINTDIKNRQKDQQVLHPTVAIEREIATRYGGHIENQPLNKALTMGNVMSN